MKSAQKVTKKTDPTGEPRKEKVTTTEPQEEFIEQKCRPSRPAPPSKKPKQK